MIEVLFKVVSILLPVISVLGLGTAVALIVAPAVALPVIKSLVSWFLDCRFCVLVTVVVIACCLSFWVGRWGAYQDGVDDTVARVARGDAKLVGRALDARRKLKECQAQGSTWDQSTGTCR